MSDSGEQDASQPTQPEPRPLPHPGIDPGLPETRSSQFPDSTTGFVVIETAHGGEISDDD
jgi:hypothetical protein